MIWIFEREGERLRCEISRDESRSRYRIVVTRPDGSESIDEIEPPRELIEHSVQLMQSLRNEGWLPSGS